MVLQTAFKWTTSNVITVILGVAFLLYLLWWISCYIWYIVRVVWYSQTHGNYVQPLDHRPVQNDYDDQGGYVDDDYEGEYYEQDNGYGYGNDDEYYEEYDRVPEDFYAPPRPSNMGSSTRQRRPVATSSY